MGIFGKILEEIKKTYELSITINQRIDYIEKDFERLGKEVEKIASRLLDLEKCVSEFTGEFRGLEKSLKDKTEMLLIEALGRLQKQEKKLKK
jgi:hypothetical protein